MWWMIYVDGQKGKSPNNLIGFNRMAWMSTFELDMNCDFSSNNNIWAGLYEFLWRPFWILLGYFDYDRLTGMSRMSFLAAILNRNFRLRTSDFKFQTSPLSFCTFDLSLCWLNITIRDASPTLKQHWFNVLCLKRIATVILTVAFKRFQLSISNTQYWLNTGQLSATLARIWNIG